MFGKEIPVIQRKCEEITDLKMTDVFPDGNGFIIFSEKNIESVHLFYRNIESLNRVFELAVQKLSEDGINSEYHISNNTLVFYATVPCNHYGITVK